MKPTLPHLCIIMFVCILSACSKVYSPGGIPADTSNLASFPEKLTTLKIQHQNHFGSPPNIIGHSAGSYYYFPMRMKVNKEVPTNTRIEGNSRGLLNKSEPALSINALIDNAFLHYNLDAIEIDLRTPSSHLTLSKNHVLCQALHVQNKSCISTLHDKPEWRYVTPNNQAFKYLLKNNLDDILEHFATQPHTKGKRLYLELKAPKAHQALKLKAEHAEQAQAIITLFASAINKAINKHPHLAAQLGVSSFSADYLTRMQAALKKPAIKYALILGFSKPWQAYFAQIKGPVPAFNQATQDFLRTHCWLDEAWFSTKSDSHIVPELETLQAMHHKDCNKTLAFNVAQYDVSPKAFARNIKRTQSNSSAPIPPLNLRGVMVDIHETRKN